MDARHPDTSSSTLHVVFGSGGTKAILAGTGAALAFRVAGMTDWQSVGGASGGSIPAALLASNQEPAVFLRHVVDTQFDRLVVPRRNFLGRWLAIIRKYHFEMTRPAEGAYGTELFGKFVDEVLPQWPEKFWTVASCGHGQVLFGKGGVYKYEKLASGAMAPAGRLLVDRPPALGMAICATCAMPGIIDAVEFRGEHLFDGALSGDGECPVGVIPRHFQTETRQVIAVDVGEEQLKNAWWLRALFHIGCGGKCETSLNGRHLEDGDALLVIRPQATGFHALQFDLERHTKWRAVIAGFKAAAKALSATHLCSDAARVRLADLAARLDAIETAHAKDDEGLTCAVESYLTEQGLFSRPAC